MAVKLRSPEASLWSALAGALNLGPWGLNG